MDSQHPYKGYVICSEHRSGSTYLCELLTSTGLLGHPDEYFRFTEDSVRVERDPSYLDEVIQKATGANGIYGLKVFSQQFDVTMNAGWVHRLPNLKFVHLERRDLLGQAISMVRALQTQQYTSEEESLGEPRFDRHAIDRHIRRITEAQGRWRVYFARNGIEPVWLTYEDLIKAPRAAVQAIAFAVGLEHSIDVNVSRSVRIQRDEVSKIWRARYLEEAADRSYLDHPLGQWRVSARRLARDAGQMIRRLKAHSRSSRP